MSARKSTRPPRRRSTPFSYTVPSENRAAHSFVAAGSGEAREGGPSYEGRIVLARRPVIRGNARESALRARGDGAADGGARLRLGGCDHDPGYTIFDIHPLLADEFGRRAAMSGGLTWHFARPPVQGLDFEVDVRGVACELVI